MLIGVHRLHHEKVGTGSHLTASHQKEGQFLQCRDGNSRLTLETMNNAIHLHC